MFVIFIELFSISNSVISFECNLYNIEVDKESYHPDEIIKINASWNLDYNPINEEAYIQVRLTDEFDTIIWNSSKYDGIGNFSENWSVYINQLNQSFNNFTHSLYLKFLSVYHQIGTMDIISNLLIVIQIKIIKRISSCQLIGFKDRMNYGEILNFQAKFYDTLIENNTFLNNQLIEFLINSNNSIIFQSNFTTNEFGIIEVSIASFHNLSLGVNYIVLKLGNNNVFNDSTFQYEVLVERSPIFIDILNFNENLNPQEDLIINLYYYYFYNNSFTPLKNQYIELLILSEKNITYAHVYYTDIEGVLAVTIPYDLLSFNIESKELKLNLIYNGSLYLANITLSLDINLNLNEPESGFQFVLVSLVSVPTIIILVSLIILFKFKKPKKMILPDIIIRY
jgi:hypothetical protein